ncbi:MAG: peptidoglycan DD-metalloendopeptidase family protein [FCB group bacterium]|nr:peptidoglycan DD-metalloendopeptidase family protein [FCB group bacterium]
MIFRIIILYLLLTAPGLYGQAGNRDFQKEINYQTQEIERLKQEIEAARKRVNQESRKEKSTAKNITALDEEISLLDRLITQLNDEERQTRKQINQIEASLGTNRQKLEDLRARYARRAVRAYKKGRLSSLESVLSSTTWRQAVYRTHYLKLVADIERDLQRQMESLITDIGKQKLDLEIVLRKNRALRNDRSDQQKTLRQKKIAKQRELAKIRSNKSELAKYIQEKEAGLKDLEALMKRIVEAKEQAEREERIRRQQELLKSKNFAQLKGRLNWPAEGRVITKFGRQWNAELKTATESPGIDIKGKPGSPITTTMNGVVTAITYIRGYGTTIIIDHGGGYYTVYSHVNNIQTNEDSEVQAGDVIAYMGNSGSINGSMLHFEIWGNSQKLNPELWLKKR